MAWEFILQTLWFPVGVCVLRGRVRLKKSFVFLAFIMRQVPVPFSETLFCPFIVMAKSRLVSMKLVWVVSSRGSFQTVILG